MGNISSKNLFNASSDYQLNEIILHFLLIDWSRVLNFTLSLVFFSLYIDFICSFHRIVNMLSRIWFIFIF